VYSSSFQKILFTFSQFFIEPLVQKKLIKEADIKTMFINVEEIIATHSLFLAKLHQSMNNFPLTNLGSLLYEQIPSFFIYITFCNRYNEALDRIKEMKSTSKDFNSFLDSQRKVVPGGHPLHSLFIQPVQRLPRYSLLLKELINKTPEDHVDYEKFFLSKEKVDKILETVNDNKRKYEIAHAMLRIQQYTFELPNLKVDYTKYVGEDLASIQFSKFVTGKNGSGLPPDEKDCLLFLFSDILLIFEITKKPKRLSFSLIPGNSGKSKKIYFDKKNDIHIFFKNYYYLSDSEVVQYKKKVIGLHCHDFESKENIRLDILVKEMLGNNRADSLHDNLLDLIDKAQATNDIYHINPHSAFF
jgi:hypothetical protein